MRLIYKYIKLFRRFDISPISGGNMSKVFLFTFWGINAIIFLSTSIGVEHNNHVSCKYCNGANYCTITKKLDIKNADTKLLELIKPVNFIIISSYDYEVPQYDVTIKPTGRAPPSMPFI